MRARRRWGDFHKIAPEFPRSDQRRVGWNPVTGTCGGDLIYDKGPRVFAARSLVYNDCTCTRYGRFNFLGYQTVRRAAGSFITLRSAWQSRPLVFFLGSTCEVLLDVAVSTHLTRSLRRRPVHTRLLSGSSSLHLCGLYLCAAASIHHLQRVDSMSLRVVCVFNTM